MSDVTQLAIQAAMKKMVDGGHFSICVIDDIVKATGVIPDGEAYKTLRLLHCINFRDMDRELLRALPDLMSQCVNGPKLDLQFTLQPASRDDRKFIMVEEPRTFLGKLLIR